MSYTPYKTIDYITEVIVKSLCNLEVNLEDSRGKGVKVTFSIKDK